MHDWVAAAASSRPDHPAVEVGDSSLSYAELNREASTCARRLAALGVGEGGRVATTLPPSLPFAVLMHGAARIGAALVPLNTRLPTAQQRLQAKLARADAVVGRPLDGFEASAQARTDVDPDAVHSVLFTSGTTAEPKPVELTLANQDAAAAASAAVAPPTAPATPRRSRCRSPKVGPGARSAGLRKPSLDHRWLASPPPIWLPAYPGRQDR